MERDAIIVGSVARLSEQAREREREREREKNGRVAKQDERSRGENVR